MVRSDNTLWKILPIKKIWYASVRSCNGYDLDNYVYVTHLLIQSCHLEGLQRIHSPMRCRTCLTFVNFVRDKDSTANGFYNAKHWTILPGSVISTNVFNLELVDIFNKKCGENETVRLFYIVNYLRQFLKLCMIACLIHV